MKGHTMSDNETDTGIGSRIVAFRCPLVLVQAMEAFASESFTSVSTIARQAILKEMRERGYMPGENHDR